MTPSDYQEMLKAFTDIKDENVKALVAKVLEGQHFTARQIAERIVHEEKVFEAAKRLVARKPETTRQEILTLIRTSHNPDAKIPLTVWDRLLNEGRMGALLGEDE